MNTNKIFAAAYNFFRRFKVNEKKVLLIEKLDTGGCGSLYSVKDECQRRELDLEFHTITHKDYRVSPGNLFGLIRLFTVKAYHMATSGHIFLNDNFLPMAYMKVPEETTVVQLWHGMGSFKRFAGSTEEDPNLREILRLTNEKVDHILASAEGIRENYAEAFMVPKEKVLATACPQADYYFAPHNLAAWRKQFERLFPQIKGKKIVLYAPTFRGDEKRDRELLEHFDFKKFQEELGDRYCLMVRLHPQIHSGPVPEGVLDMTNFANVRKLLLLTDLLIADYSSIAVEYALLKRPIILYAFDKDWYLKHDRGFYYDYEMTAPGPVVTDMQQLIQIMREEKWDLDKVDRFAHLHNDFFDDQSAARIVDSYFGKEGKDNKMKIIAGLGNPTDKYKGTRHNIGFMAVDKICDKYNITVNQHKFKAMTGQGFIGGQKVLIMKPLTYMNLSGESIRQAADFYKVDAEDILIIYDDISLEPGMLRIRKKGSAGGHNGMKSIINHLGCDTFPRLRVGIGGERHPGMDLADYVLGHFGKEEGVLIDQALDNAALASELFCMDAMDEAMNKYSVGKKKKKKEKKEVKKEEKKEELQGETEENKKEQISESNHQTLSE